MKRLLFYVAVLCISFTSKAQIKIEDSFTNNLIIIGNISSGAVANVMGAMSSGYSPRVSEHRLYCRIYREKVTYGILIDTGNRFDDDFEFSLGTDIEKARESIKQILDFMANKPLKTSITVTDEDERKIQINLNHRKFITLNAIDAKGAIIADNLHLYRSHLERALKLLDKKAEDKVNEVLKKNNQ